MKLLTIKQQIDLLRFGLLVFSLLHKNIEFDKSIIERAKEKETVDYSRIRCPHCNWQPKKESKWFCSDCDAPEFFYDACGTEWNTFETGGKCPGCRHQWRWTSCLLCSQWSPHKDWYVTAEKK